MLNQFKIQHLFISKISIYREKNKNMVIYSKFSIAP